MLYAITYRFNDDVEKHQGFFDTLTDIGEIDCPFDGCVLLHTVLTVYAIRKRILPFFKPVEHICISEMYKNHAAGKLPERSKKFIEMYIVEDPTKSA